MLLAVNVIVRDEAAHLAACLASVRAVADEVVVHDTGSADDSVAVARAAGAVVVEGRWEDDFAAARDVALEATSAPWVLALDADERWQGRPEDLRRVLQDAVPGVAFTVAVTNLAPAELGGDYQHRAPRLFRRSGTRWHGRVHEEPAGPQVRELLPLPAETGAVLHLGYADPAAHAGKSARNAALAQAELDRLVAEGEGDPRRVAAVVLDLGRSMVGAGRRQEAVDAFEAVRELAPGTASWLVATDFLARLLLAEGYDDVVLVLVEQLRAAGAGEGYCDWLAAPALTQLGRAAEALPALRGVSTLVGPGGRTYDPGQVHELRSLVAAVAGERGEAVEALALAMAGHGRVSGRGPLLLELAAGREGELAALLVAHGDSYSDALVTELEPLGVDGRVLADALRARRATARPRSRV